MICDICEAPLPPDYACQVDARGRPCLAICEPCNSGMVRERAQRLGLPIVEVGDLIDIFESHLAKILSKERVH